MSKKRRKSFPSLFNPFGIFKMGNTNTNRDNDEKTDSNHASRGNTIYNESNNLCHDKFKNNTQIQFLSGHNGIVRDLCKIDNERFASCSDDCLILIWSATNGLLLDVLMGHKKPITSLVITEYKSHKLLISSSIDHTIRIWDITSSSSSATKCISILNNHNAPISKVIICENNKNLKTKKNVNLITASCDGQIGVWSFNENFKFQSQCKEDENNNNEDKLTSLKEDETVNREKNCFMLLRMINTNDGAQNNKHHRWNRNNASNSNSSLMSSSVNEDSLKSQSTSSVNTNTNTASSTNNKISGEPPQITQMLLLNTTNAQQLIVGCKNGTIIFINFAKHDRIKLICKHCTEIKYLYQLSIDRFISASYDGLICVWRIEQRFPQLLDRINDPTPIQSWSPPRAVDAAAMMNENNKKKNKKNKNKSSSTPKTKTIKKSVEITEPKDLKLNCFIHFVDEFGDKYFIVTFDANIIIFDAKLAAKVIVKNDDREIFGITTIKNNTILVSYDSRNIVKLWNLRKLNLNTIQTGIWLSCFRQDLLCGDNEKNKKSSKHKKNTSRAVDDLCVDYNNLLINSFSFHSDSITQIRTMNDYSFITSDKMNQIILWKDSYIVSYLQNQTIKKHYNLQYN